MKELAQKLFKKKVLSASVASLLLTACGGTGQDQGSSASGNAQVFSGVAVDGHLARATVYLDTNNNGTRDAWESFAFTDNDGYYSYNPLTQTNYCATDASAEQAQYCLRSPTPRNNVVVRVDGGYDILTGEPFAGQLSRRIDASDEQQRTGSVVSPLTSIVADIDNSTDRSALLTSMSISESDLDVDYLNTDGNGATNVDLLNKALKIHKVVAVLSDRLTDTYSELGENIGVPNDASGTVYPILAQQIIEAGSSLDNALDSSTLLLAALDSSEEKLREIYGNKELTLPPDMGSVSNPGNFQRVADVASEFTDVVDTLVDTTAQDFDLSDAKAGARALETLVIKALNEPLSNDPSINNAIDFFTDNSPANQTLIDGMLTNLSQDTADVSGLSNNDFAGSDFDSVEEISQVASLPSGVSAFTQVGGMQLKVSDLDLGSPNDLRDIELEVYFNGEVGDIDGSYSACVKYIDGAKADGSLGEGNTRGELVTGYWSLLGASEGRVSSYSLLMTITFLGTTYQSILKPAASTMVNGSEVEQVRFDYDGDFGIWQADSGFVAIDTVPESNEQCAKRLPSRIGL